MSFDLRDVTEQENEVFWKVYDASKMAEKAGNSRMKDFCDKIWIKCLLSWDIGYMNTVERVIKARVR